MTDPNEHAGPDNGPNPAVPPESVTDTPAEKTPAKAARKTPAKKAPAKKATARKTTTRKTTAKKAPAKKTTAQKTTAQKTAQKTTAQAPQPALQARPAVPALGPPPERAALTTGSRPEPPSRSRVPLAAALAAVGLIAVLLRRLRRR